jgi:hypothetical protein
LTVRLNLESLQTALELVAERIDIQPSGNPASHISLRVTGVETPDVVRALGTYLVGCLAGAVKVDATLAARFLGSSFDVERELRRRVHRRIGADNDWSTETRRDWRDRRRNPWVAEAIAHALLMVAGSAQGSCVAGTIQALKPLHAQVTQQGLDLVGIYEDDEAALWLAVGECKATKSRASQELTNATGFYRELESGARDGDLVADLLMLEAALADEALDEIGEALWEGRRTYLPLVAYEESFDVTGRRPGLARLAAPREHRRVLLVQLSNFHAFFDDVADAARGSVGALIG